MPLPEITPEQEALYSDWFHGRRKAVEVGRGGAVMAGPKKNKVEKFKLTDEQIAFTKQYKRLKQVQSILEGATFVQQERARSLRQMWMELNQQFQMLQPPGAATHELSGQDESSGGGLPPSAVDAQGQPWMINY